jgi:hypothetical protein
MFSKTTLLAFLFFLLPIQLFSQITISGQINDKSNKPIEFLEIQLQNKDSIIVKSELTNGDGKFTIAAEKGAYQLLVKQLGKILQKQKITANQDLNLGLIQVTENPQQLQEVTVTSKKRLIERKVDRLVFNVENSVSASSGDALDALKVTPGIRVQNEAISMIGKSGIGLMVDDRLVQLSGDDLVNYLKTISSENIKSIEVITTPPAKYDAEGNSGLINIKLKKPKNDSWSASFRNTMKQARYFSDNVGANFSFQKKKISLSADLGYYKSKTLYENDITYNYPSSFWNYYAHSINNTAAIIPTIILNYKVTDKTTFGIQYVGAFNNPTNYDYSNSTVTNKNTGTLENKYLSNGSTKIDFLRTSFNANGVTKFNDKGKMMTFDLDYLGFVNNKWNPSNSIILDNTNSIILDNNIVNKGDFNVQNYAAKLDFTVPTTFANYEYGGKLSFINTNSEVNLVFHDNIVNSDILTQNTQFNYKENSQALYFSANKKIKKWEFKAGLRFENTQTKGKLVTGNQITERNYNKFFPTLYTTYTPNEKNSFSLTLNRRINRPRYMYVNPARTYAAINNYVYGNPFLQPSFAYNFELKHSYKDIFSSTLSYTIEKENVSQVNIPKLDNTQVSTWENYANSNKINFDESINYNVNKWWATVSSFYFYYLEFKSLTPIIKPNGSGLGSGFGSRHTFTANKAKTFFIEGYFSYDAQSISMQTKISPASSLDISVKHFFLEKNLQMTVLFSNILKSDRITASYTANGIEQSFRQYYDTQFVRFSLSYKFGNNKIGIKQRKLGNQEEIQRSN